MGTRSVAWLVWIMGSLFYAYQFMLRVMPNIMLDDIMGQFHIDAAVFGQYAGVYYIGYCLMHLPIGIMLDRYGPKNVMPCCILATVLGLTPILYAENWIYPIMGRALIGMGSSAAILGTFKIIRMNFNEKHFSRMLSLTVAIGLLGAIYGGGPVGTLCTRLGYQTVVYLFAALGVGMAALTYFLIPAVKPDGQDSVLANIRTVLTNRKVVALCLFAGFMVGPMEGFADVWASDFLKRVYGLDTKIADYLPSMIFVGMCGGAPILSFIAEKTGYYFGTIIGSGLVMCVTFLALLMGALTLNSLTFGFLSVGLCCAYQILVIYKASTYVPEQLAGLTTAIANMIIMSFGYGFHSVIGFIVNAYGGVQVSQSLVYGISVIPITLGIGVIGFFMLALQEKKNI